MGRSWLGSSIRGLASQFADLPALAPPPRPAAPIPAITPIQPIDTTGSLTPPGALAMAAAPIAPTPLPGSTMMTDPGMGVSPIMPPMRSLLDTQVGPIRSPVRPVSPGLNTTPGGTGGFAGSGALSTLGGEWSTLDSLNPAIASAASQTGVPPNLIKAMLAREGGFGKDKWVNSNIRPGDSVYAFNGIFKSTADSYGIDFNRMTQDDGYAVWAMGRVLQGIKQNNPQLTSWDDVAGYYFAGPNYNNPNWGDETGTNTVQNYKYGNTGVITRWHQLDGNTGSTGGGFGDGGTGNSIVEEAKQYVGVPYIWGSLPGANDDPWQTGWDCSAFVNYLDDKYGSNELPAGSHYQYQDSVNKGLINTDPSQMQVGDLLFWDTGDHSGGGGNLNNASHVSIYIGNGQMIHAANPGAGTIISNVSDYMNMYGFMGERKMGWSGGTGGGTGGSMNPGRQGWRQWLHS